MKPIFILLIACLFFGGASYAQKLESGTYTFQLKDAEYLGNPIVGKCTVIIKGKSVKATYLNGCLSMIKKNAVYDEGILLYHKKSKQWIIGHSPKDAQAPEVGGCSGGPRVIDFKQKIIWNC